MEDLQRRSRRGIGKAAAEAHTAEAPLFAAWNAEQLRRKAALPPAPARAVSVAATSFAAASIAAVGAGAAGLAPKRVEGPQAQGLVQLLEVRPQAQLGYARMGQKGTRRVTHKQ